MVCFKVYYEMWNYAWFFVSAAVPMTPSLFWDITHRRVVVTDVSGRPVGPIFKQPAVQEEFWISRSVDWYLPTFRYNVSAQPSRVKQSKKNVFFLDCLKIGLKRLYVTAKARCVKSHKNEDINVKSASIWCEQLPKICEILGVSRVRCRHVDVCVYR
jgi:hypothetical protein